MHTSSPADYPIYQDVRRPSDFVRVLTQGGRHKQPFDLGVRFVFGSANSRCRGITFTHVRAALCVSVRDDGYLEAEFVDGISASRSAYSNALSKCR